MNLLSVLIPIAVFIGFLIGMFFNRDVYYRLY